MSLISLCSVNELTRHEAELVTIQRLCIYSKSECDQCANVAEQQCQTVYDTQYDTKCETKYETVYEQKESTTNV